MSNSFEFFEGTATESADVPRITVRKGGVLVLTRATVEMLGEGTTHVPGARSSSVDNQVRLQPGYLLFIGVCVRLVCC